MTEQELNKILKKVADGTILISEAIVDLKSGPFKTDTSEYVDIDYHRQLRQGLPEVIYGKSKTVEQILNIAEKLIDQNHPILLMENQKVKVAEQSIKAAQSNYLPQLNLQYGMQEVAGESGFYQYQLGVNIPLFFNTEKGKVQSAKISRDIAEQRKTQSTIQLKSERSIGISQRTTEWSFHCLS